MVIYKRTRVSRTSLDERALQDRPEIKRRAQCARPEHVCVQRDVKVAHLSGECAHISKDRRHIIVPDLANRK